MTTRRAHLSRWYRFHFAPALKVSALILVVAVAVDVVALHRWGQSFLHPFAADIVSALLTLVILLTWSVRHSKELVKLDDYHRAVEAAMVEQHEASSKPASAQLFL